MKTPFEILQDNLNDYFEPVKEAVVVINKVLYPKPTFTISNAGTITADTIKFDGLSQSTYTDKVIPHPTVTTADSPAPKKNKKK